MYWGSLFILPKQYYIFCKGISNFLSKRVRDYKIAVIMYQYLLFYNLPITPVLFKYQIKLRYLRCFGLLVDILHCQRYRDLIILTIVNRIYQLLIGTVISGFLRFRVKIRFFPRTTTVFAPRTTNPIRIFRQRRLQEV